MRLYRDHHHAGLSDASVVAIGNFDGVHRGHQALLRRSAELAAGVCAPARVVLVTFEPLPRAFFDPEGAPPRLSGPAEKLRRVQGQGVDLTWMLRFNGALASMSARAFVESILVRGLAAKAVVIGGDFRFGCGREGDLAMMRAFGDEHGFRTEEVPPVRLDGERISSTAIRDALAEGRLDEAAAMLGRPFSVTGHVVTGQRLGRELGYPTANLRPWGGRFPLTGVFAVRARWEGGAWREGVASVGVRPAVGGGEPLAEVHLFDYSGNLYGKRLEARFIERLRDETHFPSLDALKAQMKNDEARARTILAVRPAE